MATLIENGNPIRNLPQLKIPPKKKISNQAPPEVRKSELKSNQLPSINIMVTNADQLSSAKMTELQKRIKLEKPLIIVVCEVKPMNHHEGTEPDYVIPGYSIHPVNMDSSIGVVIYTHSSLDKSVNQIIPELHLKCASWKFDYVVVIFSAASTGVLCHQSHQIEIMTT